MFEKVLRLVQVVVCCGSSLVLCFLEVLLCCISLYKALHILVKVYLVFQVVAVFCVVLQVIVMFCLVLKELCCVIVCDGRVVQCSVT